MGFKVFRFSIILLIIYMPVHIVIFFATPGPILTGGIVDEMIAVGTLYRQQVIVSNIALEYMEVTLKALEIEIEMGSLRELNELVEGERIWRHSLERRIFGIESKMKKR